MQAGNYCIKNFESGIVTLSKEILNIRFKNIIPNAAFLTSINLDEH